MKPRHVNPSVILHFKPAGIAGQYLPLVRGFGTSMMPFLRSNEDLRFEPVAVGAVRLGDVLVYHPRPKETSIQAPESDRLVTHRVVRRLQVGEQIVFLTKGDNRLMFDPVVFPDQIVGRVVRAGKKDLTQGWWRGWGVGIARISYLQAVLYHRLMCLPFGRLNKLWLALARRGRIPSLALQRCYKTAVVLLLRGPRGVGDWSGGWRRRCSAAIRGIRLERWKPDNLEAMTEVWNASFPHHPTTPERLKQRVLTAPDFDSSRCWILRRNGNLLGWGFSNGSVKGRACRRIEGMALTPEGWVSGTAGLLFRRLIQPQPGEHPSSTECGPMPVSAVDGGIVFGRAAELAARHGFYPVSFLTEMVLTQERFQRFRKELSLRSVTIRSWRADDTEYFRTEFKASEYNERILQRHLALGGRLERILVAVRNHRPVGVSLWLPDEDVCSWVHLGGWIWSVAKPRRRRGFFFHLVVDVRERHRGVGPLLTWTSAERLFDSGCPEMLLWTKEEKLYRKLGFVSGQRFVRMRREEHR